MGVASSFHPGNISFAGLLKPPALDGWRVGVFGREVMSVPILLLVGSEMAESRRSPFGATAPQGENSPCCLVRPFGRTADTVSGIPDCE